jgi:hypothetical protein
MKYTGARTNDLLPPKMAIPESSGGLQIAHPPRGRIAQAFLAYPPTSQQAAELSQPQKLQTNVDSAI